MRRGADDYCTVDRLGRGSGLGRARCVVERTFAHLHHFKRLLVRLDRRAEIHEAFLAIGCRLFRRLWTSMQAQSS
jgi:transposase